MAEFIVKYRAIVYRPFKGETVDGIVGNVNKVRRKDISLFTVSLHVLILPLDGLFCRSRASYCLCVKSRRRPHPYKEMLKIDLRLLL